MLKTIAATLALCLCLPGTGLSSDLLIPGGFQDIRIGTLQTDVPGLSYVRSLHVTDDMAGDFDITYHRRPGDNLTFLDSPLDSVEYGFCDEYLCTILVRATGAETYRRILEKFVAEYGTEHQQMTMYDTLWDRHYTQEVVDGLLIHTWLLCECQTDNCAQFSIRYHPPDEKILAVFGEQHP